MRLLARLEGAPPTPATIEIPVSTTPVGLSIVTPQVCYDSYGSFFSSSRPSCDNYYSTLGIQTKFGAQHQSLTIALSIALPLFMVPLSFASPVLTITQQKSFE